MSFIRRIPAKNQLFGLSWFDVYGVLHPGQGGADGPTIFYLPMNDSGLSNLDQNLTINGTTVAPTFIYEGKNATVSD
jgi:hypothetical protein